jgi:hypothetical protein
VTARDVHEPCAAVPLFAGPLAPRGVARRRATEVVADLPQDPVQPEPNIECRQSPRSSSPWSGNAEKAQ